MSRRASSLPLVLPPKPEGVAAYQWLRNGFQQMILAGTLPSGYRLPATRDLAAECGVARGTVVAAIDELKAEGYLTARHGSGTYVSSVLPEQLLTRRRTGPQAMAPQPSPQRDYRLSRFGSSLRPFSHYVQPRTLAFRTNLPALDLFPTEIWNKVMMHRLKKRSTAMLLGCEAMGLPRLRRIVAGYLRASRGVICEPEQVLILSGIQEAIDLVSRLLVRPGDDVALEDPGYQAAHAAFLAAGANLKPISIDAEGAVVDRETLRGVRVIYVTPGHQFPTGVTMSLRRRLMLLDHANRCNTLIFEDDYDSEYRYCGRPLPCLQGLDTHQTVIFAGSFNKILFPSLRLAYVVVPPGLVEPFSDAKHLSTRHHPLLEQETIADFIEEGHFNRHVRRMRQIYGERLAMLLDCSRKYLSGALEVQPIEAGLQTTAMLMDGLRADVVAAAALKRNIDVNPLENYSITGAAMPTMLQIGFAAVDERDIKKGVITLASVMEELRASYKYA